MAFQPRGSKGFAKNTARHQAEDGKTTPSSPGNTPNFGNLVDQIAAAVQDRLVSQGVPLTGTKRESMPKQNTKDWRGLINQGADRIGHASEGPFQSHLLDNDTKLAAKIDHTLLKPDATKEDIERVCAEARKYSFATVCVNSAYVGLAAELLKGYPTKAIAVVGFPLGAAATATKAFEAREAVKQGAAEIDMVINIGALKSQDYALVLEDIKKVVEASSTCPVKVILETSNLTNEEKVIGCALSKAAGAAFVKTSTGFASGGATEEDIALMRRIVGPEMGVKASGGIRTYEDAAKMIAAGANRIGASASIAIVTHDSKSQAEQKTASSQKNYKNSLY